jgi:hypothetical protein
MPCERTADVFDPEPRLAPLGSEADDGAGATPLAAVAGIEVPGCPGLG